MKKRDRLRKGLAILLSAAMAVGLLPGTGTMKVSAEKSEASGSVAAAEGYDANGFCTSYELTNGTWALKSGETCTHGDCNGYQPAVERQLDYDINGDKKIDAKDKAYKITNAGQLYWFAGLVNGTLAGVTQNKYANAVLTANITVNENVLKDGVLNSELENLRAWTPIGPNTNNRYYGSFDGQGYTVSGLYFNDTSVSFVGLFGWSRGTIKNVGVVASYLKGKNFVGGVCGETEDTTCLIMNCYNTSTVCGTKYVGGVCGANYGSVTNCYNTGGVTATGSSSFAGGVCGSNYGSVTNCYNTGGVTVTVSSSFAGGVCGSNDKSVTNCYNTGTVSGSNQVGGVCGKPNDYYTIKNCYYLDTITNDSNATAKTTAQFASGEVTYLLNECKSGADVVWRQTLTETAKDAIPVLDISHSIVYVSQPCEIAFANEVVEKKHTVTMSEDGTSHTCSVCNKTEQHADVATFTVDNENHSITATCPSCGDLGTITVSASDATYDGTDKAASTSGEIKGFTTPAIVYEKKADNGSFETINSTPKDAGTYTASITLGDASISVVYTIEKAIWKSLCGNVVANESIRGKADGKWKIIIADNDTETERKAKLEYKLKSEDDSEYKEVSGDSIENLAAGTYSIRRMEDDNHKPDHRSSNEFIIDPGRYLTVTMPAVTLEQDGYEVSCAALSAKNYNLEWHEGYSFEINIDEKNYHRGKDYKVLVNDKEIQETDGVYVVPGSSVEEDQKVEVQGVEKHTCVYETSENKDSIIEKCSYCKKEISTVTITAPEAPVYDGRAKEATIAGAFTQNQDTPEIKYARYKDDTETYEPLGTAKPINAGKYQASITVEGATATVTYEIDKASLKNYVTVVPYEGVYDGCGHGISVTVSETAPDSNDEAVIRYRTNEEENYSDKNPSFTDVGTYTVYYKVSKNKYYDLEGESKVVITQKPVTVTAEDKTKTYGQKNPAFTFTVPDGALVASDTKEDLAVVLNCLATASSPVTAEGYAITGTSDSTNYNVTVTPGTLTINKADATITVGTTSYDKTFGDADFPLEGISDTNTEADVQYEVTTGNDVVSVSNGTVTILKAGTATITVLLPASTNYNAAEKDITVTVNKADAAPNKPNNTMEVDYGKEKVSDITTLPEGWAWKDADKEKALTVGTAVAATAVYTGADAGNYETETVEISITRQECTHATTEVKNAKDATCTGKGYTGDTYCKDCGAKLASGTEIEMTAHKWDAGMVTKEATETAEGVKTYTCSVCGKTKTEAIPKKAATTLQPPKKGDVVKDDKTSAKVEVADVTKKEVEYKAPANPKAETVSIPTAVKIDGVTYKVTKINDNAFKGNKTVTEVTVGSNIKTIGKNAFSGATKLETVKIGKNVTEIGANAFKGCTSLTSVTLPGKTTKIGANAFKGCKKLKTIKITSTKLTSKTVAKNAFKGLTKATTIKVPKKKLAAYKRLFKQKGLSSKVKVKGY